MTSKNVEFLYCYMRVIEYDMSFPYLIYFINIELTAFHALAGVCSVCIVVNTFLLTFAHCMAVDTEEKKSKQSGALIVCKLANVVLTVLAFLQIFYADLHFDIGDDITAYMDAMGY